MPRMTDKEFQAKLDDCEVEEEYLVCKSECLRARVSEARLIEALRRLLVDHSKTARDMARAALKGAE